MPPFSSLPSCRPTANHWLARGAWLTSAAVIGSLLISGPAFASPTVTHVTDRAGVAAAFANGDSVIELDDSVNHWFANDPNGAPSTPAGSDVTLDLHGNYLPLDQIRVGDNATLTVTDSTLAAGANPSNSDGLHIDASNLASPHAGGIEIGAGATMRLDHVFVVATGGAGGAGIGSAEQDSIGAGRLVLTNFAFVEATGGDGGAGVGGGLDAVAVATTVDSSQLSATGGLRGAGVGSGSGGSGGALTTASSSTAPDAGYTQRASIDAVGGAGGAGIGGGLGANGFTVDLNGSAYASAQEGDAAGTTSDPASAVGFGQDASDAFGALSIEANAFLDIPEDRTLRVPTGSTVQNDGFINLSGSITGSGTVANAGGIYPQSSTASVTGVTVSGLNYDLTVDPNGGTLTGLSSEHLYTRYLDTNALGRPTAAQAGSGFQGWNTQADGAGDDPDARSLQEMAGLSLGQPVPLTIYATYSVTAQITAGSLPGAGLNAPYDQPLPVTGTGTYLYFVDAYDLEGNPIPGLPAGLTMDVHTGRVTGTPTQAGTYTFVAEVGSGYNWTRRSMTLRVAGAPIIATSAVPDGSAGNPYSTQLVASGEGEKEFSIASGSIPSGLTLSRVGLLSGIPTAAGMSTFTVHTTSTFGSTDRTFTITVATAAATGPAPNSNSPAPAPAPAPAPPALSAVPRTTVKFGHQLNIAVGTSSTLPVVYSTRDALPKGITLNRASGLLSGVPGEVGIFTATITATNSAGSASTKVVVVVPELQNLLHAKPVTPTEVGAGTVPVQVTGLKKGERWRLQIDGKTVRTGTVNRSGVLTTSVHLKQGTHDTVHRIALSTNRAVKDPATRAATEITVSSLVAKKHLAGAVSTDKSGHVQVLVTKLAPRERVALKDKGRTVAKGIANAAGRFTYVAKKLGKGIHHLTIQGGAAGRVGTVTVHSHR